MNKSLLGLVAAGALIASIPAIAQQPTSAPGTPTPTTPPAATPAPTVKPLVKIPSNTFVRGQIQGQYLARDRLIGAKIHNREGHIIGDIEDLIVGPNNQIQGVIIGTGGFLGAGEKKVGVVLSALQFTVKDGVTVISLPSATKDVLGALEPFKRAEPKKSLIDRAKEKARELTDKTTETAKDAAATAKEKAGPTYEKAKEAAGSAYEKAKDAAGSAYEKAKEAVSPSGTPAPEEKK